MFNLPIYVGLDYHTNTIQVCVMDQQRRILANQSVENSAEAVFRVVAPFGSNVNVAIEAWTFYKCVNGTAEDSNAGTTLAGLCFLLACTLH